jgi:hypothetical protein
MTEATSDAGTAGGEDIAVISAPDTAGANLSVTQAARALTSARRPKEEQAPAAPDPRIKSGEAAAEPTQESTAQAEDAAPPGEDPGATGETQEADQADTPPLERPRSWSKERADAWAKLDRDTQQYLLDHDREASATVRKAQNEAADKLKGLTAKEQAVEQARQQYEAALPQLLQNLQSQQQGEFADVRTIQDVERLAREDWPRYLSWDVAQKKIAAVTQETLSAHHRQQQEKLQRFSDFAKREDDLFIEKVPDMANAEKAAKLQSAAMTVLKDLGFNDAELGQSWNGDKDLSLRDHRVQLLIRDATLWRDAQQKAKAATTKPVPPVQRPGVAPAKGAGAQAEIQNLTRQLETASGVNAMRIAARLTAARRAAR